MFDPPRDYTTFLDDLRKTVQEAVCQAEAHPHSPPYLTTDEVIDRLRISRTTLWDIRRRGLLRGYNVGRRVLFKIEDVDGLVENQKYAAESES